MNILGIFDHMLGPSGPSPIDIDVDYEDIKEIWAISNLLRVISSR